MEAYNEPIAAAIIGLLLSASAGFRIMLPLLAVNLLAEYHYIALPKDLAWMGSDMTCLLLMVAAVAETIVHFVPVAGTWLKAAATPLAFIAGTMLMAVPLGDRNPLYQWTLAAFAGGGLATLTHLGVTGVRTLTSPANVASFGVTGILWNIGEMLLSVLFSLLGALCLFVGGLVGALALIILLGVMLFVGVKSLARAVRTEPGTAS